MVENRSSKAVEDFFAILLDEPLPLTKVAEKTLEAKPLEQLLARVSDAAPAIEIDTSMLVEAQPQMSEPLPPVVNVDTSVTERALSPLTHNVLQQQMTDDFPVLYFRVGELTMAVPLVKLRGIYPLKEVTKLIGKPNWFYGVQVERGQKISVIDTVKYIMTENIDSKLEQSLNYKYIIILGDSNWGLLCEELIDSSTLSHDDIKWRSGVLKSPWLAGTVKQRMCGLLAVDALTQLLDNDH